MNLKDKLVLIPGGSRGIGLAAEGFLPHKPRLANAVKNHAAP